MEILGAETNSDHHTVVFYYLRLEETMKECILREDFSGAQEVKIEINLFQHKMLRRALDEIMIRLYLKFRELERKIDTFIVMQLRDEFNQLETTTQTMEIVEWASLRVRTSLSMNLHVRSSIQKYYLKNIVRSSIQEYYKRNIPKI